MIYVYQCESFLKDAKDFKSSKKKISKFIKLLEGQHTEAMADSCFRPLRYTSLYKKRLDNLRILLQKTRVEFNGETHVVYGLQRVMERDGLEYGDLIEHPNQREILLRWIQDNPLPQKEIEQWVVQKEKDKVRTQPLPPIPADLIGWLGVDTNTIEAFSEGEAVFYESEEWVRETRKKFFQTWWASYYELLFDNILEDRESTGSELVQHHKDKVSILYRRCFFAGRHIYFLYAPFKGEISDKKRKELEEKYNFDSQGGQEELNHLLAHSKRTYPDYIIADKELWGVIEREDPDIEANLALSGEEEELLSQARLPLFINGQAGSGKSTMLFYLFAKYCDQKLKAGDEHHLKGEPIFLTYSSRLLEVARENILNILTTHASYLQDVPVEEKAQKRSEKVRKRNEELKKKIEKLKEKIAPFFSSFQNFLRSFFPLEAQKRFNPQSYLSFAKFKQLLSKDCHLSQKKKYSPEIVWHVIRTFIKGYSTDSFLNPEEYKKIGRSDQSVEEDVYSEIYKSFWEKWYQSATNGQYWDDQDLVRFVLQHWDDEKIKKRPVIFCDEAQDFTRVEIEFLLKISAFTSCDLSGFSSVPFAFAGDPFQTINPTGFSWKRLKETFYRKVAELNPKEIKMDLKELRQNYRSAPGIVHFANLLQFYRFRLLNERDLHPQNVWFPDSKPLWNPPFLFPEKT